MNANLLRTFSLLFSLSTALYYLVKSDRPQVQKWMHRCELSWGGGGGVMAQPHILKTTPREF